MNVLTTLAIAIFFFAMGAAIVGLIWYLKGMPGRGTPGSEQAPAADQDPNVREIARLMRNMETQELVVHMDGRKYEAPHELTPDQHHMLGFTSNVLVQWLERPGPVAEPEPAPGEALPGAAEGEFEEGETSPGFTTAFTAEMEVKPVSTELSDVVGGVMAQPNPTPPVFSSIAQQINEILQARLAGTALESRGITLTDAPDRGVLVTLDGQQYNGILELPDEEVRQVIREAVKEWETKR